MTRTLTIDCGGTGIKGSVLDERGQMLAEKTRVRTPYPLPPDRFVGIIAQLAKQLPDYQRATVGMPGMIRHGTVVATPHYVTRNGPHTPVIPELVRQWRKYEMRDALQEALGRPAIVLNDAEVAGAGAVTGIGFEVVLTLGTGLGCAIFDDARLLPHLEISRSPVRRGRIYDTYVGDASRRRMGNAAWSRRVRQVLVGLRPMFEWDRLYLGGGNSWQVAERDLLSVGGSILVVPNSAGIVGGVRAWELGLDRRPPAVEPMSDAAAARTPGSPEQQSRSEAESESKPESEPRSAPKRRSFFRRSRSPVPRQGQSGPTEDTPGTGAPPGPPDDATR